jgi:cysteine-rich repeat protein
VGADGAVGPEGRQGAAGLVGPVGADGAVGPEGRQGAAGAVGADGAVGPEGRQGAVGAVGPDGDDGIQGPPGPAGVQGPQGAQGENGVQGEPGVNVVTAEVDGNGDLQVDLSSGQSINAGHVIGPAGSDAESCHVTALEIDGQVIAGAIVLQCGDLDPVRLRTFLCGNANIDSGETCDDGNFSIGDGCDALCRLECGNNQLDQNEECDDGNRIDTDGCTSSCAAAQCGDGVVYAGVEACDGTDGCQPDCTLIGCHINASCPDFDFVPIVGGPFQMGYADGATSELPVHQRIVADFEILRAEVTVAQYRQCVLAGVCTEPIIGDQINWGRAGRDQYPVNGVSWSQASQYAAWAGARLPTEAEWEFVARSRGATTLFPWGEEEPDCTRTQNYTCGDVYTAVNCSHADGHSAEGVCDLAGNVWEWVQDNYYRDHTDAPADGSARCEQADCGSTELTRVWKGGDYLSSVSRMRASARGYYAENVQFYWMGFRLAR